MDCSWRQLPGTRRHQRAGPCSLWSALLRDKRCRALSVTPSRLNRHLTERTNNLDPRFRDIARYYKLHGEALRIRLGSPSTQMLLKTNYLCLQDRQRPAGATWTPSRTTSPGIGTTGGGVPGDSFPDVSSGVLAQMQHLIAYSGERVAKPLAPRTREKQDDIIELSRGWLRLSGH